LSEKSYNSTGNK